MPSLYGCGCPGKLRGRLWGMEGERERPYYNPHNNLVMTTLRFSNSVRGKLASALGVEGLALDLGQMYTPHAYAQPWGENPWQYNQQGPWRTRVGKELRGHAATQQGPRLGLSGMRLPGGAGAV